MSVEDVKKEWKKFVDDPLGRLPWLFLTVVVIVALGVVTDRAIKSFNGPTEPPPPPPVVLEARFAEVLRDKVDLAKALGAPAADPQSCVTTLQPFERGFMLWTTERPNALLACFDDAESTCEEYVHDALSRAEQESFDILPEALRNLFNPIGGFRLAWVHNHLGSKLGMPLQTETKLTVVVQRFSSGLLIRDVPWFRKADNQFVIPPGVQPVLSLVFKGRSTRTWAYHGQRGL